MEMLHATYLGSRKGKYRADVLDGEAGAANALQLDEATLVCTNHTTGEVVMYKLSD